MLLLQIIMMPSFLTGLKFMVSGKPALDIKILEKTCSLAQSNRRREQYDCKVLLNYQAGGKSYQSWAGYSAGYKKRKPTDLPPPEKVLYLDHDPEKIAFPETFRSECLKYMVLTFLTGYIISYLLKIVSFSRNVRRTAHLESFKGKPQPVSPLAVRYQYKQIERYGALGIAVFAPWQKSCTGYTWFMPSAQTELSSSEQFSLYENDHRYGLYSMAYFEQPFWIPGKITHKPSHFLSALFTITGRKPALAVQIAKNRAPLLLDEKLTRLDFTDEERSRLYEARKESLRLFEIASADQTTG